MHVQVFHQYVCINHHKESKRFHVHSKKGTLKGCQIPMCNQRFFASRVIVLFYLQHTLFNLMHLFLHLHLFMDVQCIVRHKISILVGREKCSKEANVLLVWQQPCQLQVQQYSVNDNKLSLRFTLTKTKIKKKEVQLL